MGCSLGLHIVKENRNHLLVSVRYGLQIFYLMGKAAFFCKYVLIDEKNLGGSF